MGYYTYIVDNYRDIIGVLSNVFGIVGFIFGVWQYQKQRLAQRELETRQRQLDDAMARLKNLQKIASRVGSYSVAV